MPSAEHNRLVKLGARWLREERRCWPVLEEPCKRLGESMEGERPDVLGWTTAYESHLIEVKVSESDFLADAKKNHHNGASLGRYRWLLTPIYLIQSYEVPDWQGLLWEKEGRVLIISEAQRCHGVADLAEKGLLLEVIRQFENKTGRTANETRPCNDNKPGLKLREIVTRHHAQSPEDTVKLIRRLHPELAAIAGSKGKAYRQIEQVLAELAGCQEVAR